MKKHMDSGMRAAKSPKPLWRQILHWPSTRMGWWSAGGFVGSILFLVLFNALITSGQRGGDTFFSNPWLALTILASAMLAIASGVLAVVAVGRDRERSIFGFLAILLGLIVLVFVIGEIAFPH